MKLIKIGGSLLYNNYAYIAEILASSIKNGPAIIVIGYGEALRQHLTACGYVRKKITSSSGITFSLSDEYIAAASVCVASSEVKALEHELKKLGVSVKGVNGYSGLLTGSRKNRIRYVENGKFKLYESDLSANNISINQNALTDLAANSSHLIITPIVSDRETGRALVCDADSVTSVFSEYVGAKKVYILSDSNGLVSNDKVLPKVHQDEIKGYEKIASGGMRKKLRYIKRMLNNGCEQVVLGNEGILTKQNNHPGTVFYWR